MQELLTEYEGAFEALGVVTANPRKTCVEHKRYTEKLEEELEAASKSAEDGKILMAASDECVQGIVENLDTGGKPDFTVTHATLRESSKNFVCVAWETKSAGFGELTFYRENGHLMVDLEAMGKDFAKRVLAKLVDEAVDPTEEG